MVGCSARHFRHKFFHQIVGFNEIVAYQELFCVIMKGPEVLSTLNLKCSVCCRSFSAVLLAFAVMSDHAYRKNPLLYFGVVIDKLGSVCMMFLFVKFC